MPRPAALFLALALTLSPARAQVEGDKGIEEAKAAAIAAEPEALADRDKTAHSDSAKEITAHFDEITLHSENPPPAHMNRGTHLRDAFGTVLYDGTPDQVITIVGDEAMVVQKRPIIKDRKNHRMFYLRGTVGTYEVGGKPTQDRYSGFVWASAVNDADLARLPTTTHTINEVDATWQAKLAPHVIGTRVIAPVPVIGTHVGKQGAANHMLRMYGWAHGNLRDFVFACTNLLGHVAGAGQVELLLPRGARVQATDIVHTVPDTESGPALHFRLCTVKIGPPAASVELATWIACQCLAKDGKPAFR